MSRRHRMPLAIALVLCFFLTACQERATFTSAFGQGIVTGTVVLGEDLGGGTPAGIEASIPGTGMEALLAADGQFVFAGVPEEAEIRFRRADGIDVSYSLGRGDATGMVIEISKSGAKRGRKRAVIGRSLQFEGLVVTATKESIVLDAAGKGIVTVQIVDSTQIRKGNRIVSATDLEAGARIHVMARPEGDGVVALLILVQGEAGGEGEPEAKVEIEGIVLAVVDRTITVDAAGKGALEISVPGGIEIRKGNRSYELSELQPGWRVHVRATRTENGLVAELILVQETGGDGKDEEGEDESRVELEGLILEISPTSITVEAAGRGPTTARIDSSTKIRRGNTSLTAEDLKAGDKVHVKAERVGDELLAKLIILQDS
ncbi:MAG TPA: DUF5666 domain-containing protein [Thermoanaerobaculia bacterium]|nr:DUF5666 domain-containing protein [Thermoanaerobaculia bacterium]